MSMLDGGSDSPSVDTFGPYWQMSRVGLDTVSWAWTAEPSALTRLMRCDVVRGAAGELRVRRSAGQPLVLGAFPARSLLFAEGRLHAVCARSDGDGHALAPAVDLAAGAEVASAAFAELGVPVDADRARLRRADLAADLRFPDREAGLQLLRALGAIELPRLKTTTWRAGGRLESVCYVTPGRNCVAARAYDKGQERGSAEAGALIRIERQVRMHGSRQPFGADWASRSLGDVFVKTFSGLVDRVELVITTVEGAITEVTRRVAAGLLTARVAERLLGTLLIWSRFGFSWDGWSAKTTQRRRRELRQLGIAVELDSPGTTVVPVGRMLNEIRAALDAQQVRRSCSDAG